MVFCINSNTAMTMVHSLKDFIDLAQYIETQQERFFNALVLAVYDGDPLWHEVRLEYDDGAEFYDLGILELNGSEKIFPIDGQHRVEGIKEVVSNSSSFDTEQIPVIFVSHKTDDAGMQRSRRLFSTLNRYAKPVSMRDIIALDEDDVVAIVSRELIDSHPLFSSGRILDSKTKAIPESNETAFTSIMTFYDCNYELLWLLLKDLRVTNSDGKKVNGRSKLKEFVKRRPSEDFISAFKELCDNYWSSLITSFDDIQHYAENEPDSRPYRNREGGNLLFRPVALIPFIKATVKVLSSKDISASDVFALFPSQLLLVTNRVWQNVIWNKDKQTMIMNNKSLMERLMLYYLDRELLTDAELATMMADLKSLNQFESMDDVTQLLEENQ